MNHATPEELHDHAYGFRISKHVPDCDDCRKAAGALQEERDGLCRALHEAPAVVPVEMMSRLNAARGRRNWFSMPALAAAVLLVGALAWILFQPRAPVDPPPIPLMAVSQEQQLEQIAARLKNPDPLQQELARLALKRYGGISIPVLERAQTDPDLIDECRGFTAADRALFKKARQIQLTADFNNVPLTTVIERFTAISNVRLHIGGVDNPDTVMVTLKLQEDTLIKALDKLKAATGLPWCRTLGTEYKSYLVNPPPYEPTLIVGTEQPAPRSSAPVRVQSVRPWIADLLRGTGGTKSREEVRALVAGLMPGAHDGLWLLLESRRADVREIAADSLRRLYGPQTEPPKRALETQLDKAIVNASFEGRPFADILLTMFSSQGIAVVVDPRVEIPQNPITFKVKDLTLKNCLKLLISQVSLDYLVCDQWILITKPEWAPFRQHEPLPLWTTPEEAQRAAGIIDDLGSEDPARQERARSGAKESGRLGLEWLLLASAATNLPLSRRYADAFTSIAEELGIRSVDRPGAANDQKLTPTQKAILDRLLTVKSSDRTLDALLKQNGLKVRFQSPADNPVLVAATKLPVDALLRAVLQPLGLDFYMDGDTIIVDAEKTAHAAVEKK